MSTQENKTIARRFYDEVLNKGNMSVADEILALDYLDHGAPPEFPRGPEGFKQLYTMVSSVFPDVRVTVEDMIAEGDEVATRLTVRGTQMGPFRGFPATGRSAIWTGMDIIRLAGDKMVERWSERDFLGMLQQVGAIPKPG